MKLPFLTLLKIILEGKSSKRFLIGVIMSFAFSIAVILCTIGLMDGFESTLVKSLRRSSGDLLLLNRDGFFSWNNQLKKIEKYNHIKQMTPVTQVEAFFIFRSNSKGVLVKGVDPKSFQQVTDIELNLQDFEVAIGKELQKSLAIKIGDSIVLTFASSSQRSQGAPILRSFKVASIVEHGVYEKDMRYIYMHRKNLLNVLNYSPSTINMALIKLNKDVTTGQLESIAFDLQTKVPTEYKIETFWEEFKTLLDAVEIEKMSITIVLQLIVVVAIFNIIAFVIFISEKKSQELFLLRALGLGINKLISFWVRLQFCIWGISCIVAIGLTYLFNYLLMHLPIFQLPGDIYVLSRLAIELTLSDYLLVFGLALFWIMFISFVSLLRLRSKTLLQGLRQEFS